MPRNPQKPTEPKEEGKKKRVSNTTLLLGAAGLFLFIVGVKRRYRIDEEREIGEALERERERARRETSHRWTDATARHRLDDGEDEDAAD